MMKEYTLGLDEAEVFALASLVRQAMATHNIPTPAARSVHAKAQALRSDAMASRDPVRQANEEAREIYEQRMRDAAPSGQS